MGGKTLWVVSTSVLLLGVPWGLAYAEEQTIIEQEREMMAQQKASEVSFDFAPRRGNGESLYPRNEEKLTVKLIVPDAWRTTSCSRRRTSRTISKLLVTRLRSSPTACYVFHASYLLYLSLAFLYISFHHSHGMGGTEGKLNI